MSNLNFFYILMSRFDCSLSRTYCEFYIAIMLNLVLKIKNKLEKFFSAKTVLQTGWNVKEFFVGKLWMHTNTTKLVQTLRELGTKGIYSVKYFGKHIFF